MDCFKQALFSIPFLVLLVATLLISQTTAATPDDTVAITPNNTRKLAPVIGCHDDYRSYNGFCNNLIHKSWGKANTGHLVLKFKPGVVSPNKAKKQRPNARLLSNLLLDQRVRKVNTRGMTMMVTFWGQFIDHTIVDTPSDKSKSFNIPLPKDDRIFKKVTGQNAKSLKFFRSKKTKAPKGPGMVPVNAISSFIDGSAIYGSSRAFASSLRSFEGGKMKTENELWMPRDDKGLFMGGDHRASENPVLSALHTLILREHNTLAKEIGQKFPDFDDEKIYQEARKINIAQVQSITYREFLPAMLGNRAKVLGDYQYKPQVNPTISALFSTAAFRVGHSLLKGRVQLVSFPNLRLASMKLTDVFFKPKVLLRIKALRFLLGAIRFNTQDVDLKIHSALRNFLFSNVKGQAGFDLAASNIQRGRDHGLPRYNDARVLYGLPRLTKFSQITKDENVVKALEEAYDGDIENIDVWIGGLAEDHVKDSSLGMLFYTSWVEEFKKLRDGDRFFFTKKGLFAPEIRAKIERVRLLTQSDSVMKDILVRNTPVTRDALKGSVFIRSPRLERAEAKKKNPWVNLNNDQEVVLDSPSPSPAAAGVRSRGTQKPGVGAGAINDGTEDLKDSPRSSPEAGNRPRRPKFFSRFRRKLRRFMQKFRRPNVNAK